MNIRIGYGYDVHRLTSGRKLVLGGVCVPYGKGLLGHSDADVLVHAIMDSILGAMALRDIGYHFPDTDEEYKDISSIVLLQRVWKIMDDNGFKIGNVDSVIAAEKPKLKDFIPEMQEIIAKTLKTYTCNVSVKATTTEGLDSTGRGEGISATAVCILEKK